MRRALGVTMTEDLPGPLEDEDELRIIDENTGEVALNVDFLKPTNHSTNVAFLRRIAELAQIKTKDPLECPASVSDSGCTVSRVLLLDLSKTPFAGLYKTYKAQVNDKQKKRKQKNECNTRRRTRRVQKAKWLEQAVPQYIELHGIDPSPLIMQDYMSDEASGPEDESDAEEVPESFAGWKGRVMEAGELLGKPEHTHVLEIVRPEWCDSEVSDVYHDLAQLRYDALSAKARAQIAFHRVHTTRSTVALAMLAPWNFMIDKDWWKNKRGGYLEETADWGRFPNAPPGFPLRESGRQDHSSEEASDGLEDTERLAQPGE